ncbi:MAG: hypothetical protein FK734_16865 [Asgard group archaeon]|nr:hypothetical protein [Asgard group archaeon]
MSSKKTDTSKKTSKSKDTTKKSTKTPDKKEEAEKSQPLEEDDVEKGKRRSLISALKRSISLKGESKTITKEPMNIVITLSPAKHLDIIEYIDENVPAGGRAEWVRDSIRLKMRIERGVYGLNTAGPEGAQKGTDEALQNVFGQFAEAMTKIMSDMRSTPSEVRRAAPVDMPKIQPTPIERTSGGPPKLKKIETEDSEKKEDFKPERPSLDDAIGAIVVVE